MTRVHIVLGSASDLEAVKASGMVETFDATGITYEVSVCSAHRNIPELERFTKEAVLKATQVFIGVAGMATALPGALAGLTGMSIPVIGVPLDEHGIDSCLYMPPGVPVLLTGVGKAGLKNATLAAAQILATGDQDVAESLTKYLASTKKTAKFNVNITENAE
jgi:5-(carboxyamino)imidazole ribonucleotide mutase